MFSKELALKVREMVEKQKVFLWKSEIDYLQREEIIKALYASREIKEAHEIHQKENGWSKIDYRSKERLYFSFYDEEKVYVWTGCYARKI